MKTFLLAATVAAGLLCSVSTADAQWGRSRGYYSYPVYGSSYYGYPAYSSSYYNSPSYTYSTPLYSSSNVVVTSGYTPAYSSGVIVTSGGTYYAPSVGSTYTYPSYSYPGYSYPTYYSPAGGYRRGWRW